MSLSAIQSKIDAIRQNVRSSSTASDSATSSTSFSLLPSSTASVSDSTSLSSSVTSSPSSSVSSASYTPVSSAECPVACKPELRVVDLTTYWRGHNHTQANGSQPISLVRSQYGVQQKALQQMLNLARYALTQDLKDSDRTAIQGALDFFKNRVLPAQRAFAANTADDGLLIQNYQLQQTSLQKLINVMNNNNGKQGVFDRNGCKVADVTWQWNPVQGEDQTA